MSAAPARKQAGLLSIGQVLARLTPEFPDLTPSKLRFLEDIGHVSPARTPSGYRKFSPHDVERLRFVLTVKRDHFLPHKKITELLDDIDAGRAPSLPMANLAVDAPSMLSSEPRLVRGEVIDAAGATKQLFDDAVAAQLIPAAEHYGSTAVQVLQALVELARYGIEPRHLRGMRATAEREAALIESAVKPVLGRRDTASQARAAEASRDMANQIQAIRDVLSRTAIQRIGS